MYFQVNVEIVDINDGGKQTKMREQYLVDAVSVTDAEVKVTKMFENEGMSTDFQVKSVKDTKILQVIE
jgi:mannose/fructose/N-acetylgalactosamine-specific phosphotransferase system component IIB